MTHLSFLQAGVVFTHVSVPATTPAGHATREMRIAVSGPRDEALLSALRAAVEQRMPALEQMPVAGERGRCDGCGDPIPVVLPGGEINLTCGGGLCALCSIARRKVLERRWAGHG